MSTGTQIRAIQALRAIAACAVVYVHAHNRVVTSPDGRALPILSDHQAYTGQAGVDPFFVISGFLMAFLHLDQFGVHRASGRFLVRRLVRVVPLYWLLTAVALAIAAVAPSIFHASRTLELPWILGNFAFVPWPNSAGSANRVITVAWTLDFEMYFYALFALALFMRHGLIVLSLLMLFSAAAGVMFAPSHPWLQLLTSPMLLEFLAGVGVACLV